VVDPHHGPDHNQAPAFELPIRLSVATKAEGSNACTVVGATYSVAESGVSLTATRTSGDRLAPGNSAPFVVVTTNPAPSLVGAASRKLHGGAGTFNLPLSP